MDESRRENPKALNRCRIAATRVRSEALCLAPPLGALSLAGAPHHDGSLADPLGIIRRTPSLTLAHIARKSHRITLGQPYNPHRFVAAQPRGSVQPGLSALNQRLRTSERAGSADETPFVRRTQTRPSSRIMTGQWRLRQVAELALGLVPATFLLLPFLVAGALGTAMAAVSGGAVDWAIAVLIGWVLAGLLGISALWVVVLSDGAARLSPGSRVVLTVGLLLGMAAAARWIWVMGTNGDRYGAATWTVWLLLLGGPVVVASFRLVQLWSWHRGVSNRKDR
jgi:hypothetical protein